jgi:hypothetical protein
VSVDWVERESRCVAYFELTIDQKHLKTNSVVSGFCSLGVAYWPLVPKYTGSNPAEAVGFFRAKKSSAPLPSEGK